ncbi:sugar phosphate nucleotidyltransferase [Alloalcanivorax marinus]|uniref:sugar phosphate nucleotidyltransferase n=1 Tax=Alloalcanivorax marinus TaxID=1177169 RepID=UPI001932C81C|nr:NDP-sugar synthase [Alloalcanivorax marinus]MBL7251079.1 NDP-sugar synthase [Alloalcanivorax marinus]
MEAIVFANRSGWELSPLDRRYCPALLPIANRAVIEYTLDDLAQAGVSRVRLVVSNQAREIEALVGAGEKWGLRVEYHLSKVEESVTAVVPRLGLDPSTPCLFVRGDVLRSPNLKNLMVMATSLDGEVLQPLLGRRNAGIAILRPTSERLGELEWPLITPADTRGRVIELLPGDCNTLETWRDLLDANLLVASHAVPGLSPRGAARPSAEAVFFTGSHCRLPALAPQAGGGVIGEHCTLDKSCLLQGVVVIGTGAVVDRACRIQDALVMPHTYLGPGLALEGKIVCGDLLLDPATGGWIQVSDRDLLGDSRVATTRPAEKTPPLERTVALIGLTLTLLLSPLLLVTGGAWRPEKRRLFSNGGQHRMGWVLGGGNRGLALLPLLVLVVRGDLRLFGADPSRGIEEAGSLGVWGPVQLWLHSGASDEEVDIVQRHFRTLSPLRQLAMLWRWRRQARRRPQADDTTLTASSAIPGEPS